MRPIFPILLCFGLAGCVSLQALRASYGDVLAAQPDILDGANILDEGCQRGAATEPQRLRCEVARKQVTGACRHQVSAISSLGGVR